MQQERSWPKSLNFMSFTYSIGLCNVMVMTYPLRISRDFSVLMPMLRAQHVYRVHARKR